MICSRSAGKRTIWYELAIIFFYFFPLLKRMVQYMYKTWRPWRVASSTVAQSENAC
jgi:hypothetical protein